MNVFDRERYEKLIANLLLSFIDENTEVQQIMRTVKNQTQLVGIINQDDLTDRAKLAQHFDVEDINRRMLREFVRNHKAGKIQHEEIFYIWADSFHNEPYSADHSYLIQARKLLNSTIFTIETIFFAESQEKYPSLLMGLARMYQIKKLFRLLLELAEPKIIWGEDGAKVLSNYSIRKGSEVSEKEMSEAIRDYFTLILLPLSSNLSTVPVPDERAQQILGKRKTGPRKPIQPPTSPAESRLFPNSKGIDLSTEFQIPQFIGDTMNRVIKGLDEQQAAAQFKTNGRRPSYKLPGPDKHRETELSLDEELIKINTANAAAEQLLRAKNPKVIQTFFALWKYAVVNGTVRFRETPISEVMKLVLKANDKANYSTKDRREFSDILKYLAAMTLTVSYIAETFSAKGKAKAVLRESGGVKLFHMVAEYAVKKQFQSLSKAELSDKAGHFDRTVITRFSGQLVPGNEDILRERGHIYFDSLLHLDANKDQKAIILGFAIQTRFNQFTDKDKRLTWDRGGIIDLCDYGKTNQLKPYKATEYIRNTMDKLVRLGIIDRYEGLTNNDADVIYIYPPKRPTKALVS